MALEINLDGKVALVTGVTRGIGKSISDQLLKAGARVLATGTNAEEIEKLNTLCTIENLKYVQLNLNDPKSVKDFISQTIVTEDIDILINNAGINIVDQALDITVNDFKKIQEVNVHGPFLLSQALGKRMVEKGWGRIVNIS